MMMMRLLFSLLGVMAIVGTLFFALDLADVELSLVPTLMFAMLLTTVLHLAMNRPRRRS